MSGVIATKQDLAFFYDVYECGLPCSKELDRVKLLRFVIHHFLFLLFMYFHC